MKNCKFRKGLVLGIIVLFVGAGIVPASVGIKKEKTTITTIGSPGYIQDLIDNASDGDTIYIPSGIYYENIIINKSISLIGENKDTTIIDSSNDGDVVYVSADWVNISGFSIRNSGDRSVNAGIKVISSNNTIMSNNIINNKNGIRSGGVNNTFTRNTISNNFRGISGGSNSMIMNNIISNNDWNGISLGSYNIVKDNTVTSNIGNGIEITGDYNKIINNNITSNNELGGIYVLAYYNIIQGNNIVSNKEYGIFISYNYPPEECSKFNKFLKNNFVDNEKDVNFGDGPNYFLLNYWNKPRLLPKPIFGHIHFKGREIPWITFDWRPAIKPYEI